MSAIEEIRAELARGVPEAAELDEHAIWCGPGPRAWRGARVAPRPAFYPVYRWRDLHAWSVLPLIVAKGTLDPNPRALAATEAPAFEYFGSAETIDREIERVGGPQERAPAPDVCDPATYAEEMARAVAGDVRAVEQRNPDAQHFVLVGGRDSLNLLLLPWQRPPIALSAAPNFALVSAFVRHNGLAIEVRELVDLEEEDVLAREVLENTCRANLEHYRWGAQLRAIAREYGAAVFWKGQLGDVVMTPFWKKYCHPKGGLRERAQKVYARADRALSRAARRAIADRWLVPLLFDALWRRGAMWQGHHMSILRGLTGATFVSAYHGPAAQSVVRRVDFAAAACEDVRPRIGARLYGKAVHYPSENPGPPPSRFRAGLAQPDRFFAALRAAGIRVG